MTPHRRRHWWSYGNDPLPSGLDDDEQNVAAGFYEEFEKLGEHAVRRQIRLVQQLAARERWTRNLAIAAITPGRGWPTL